MDRPNHMTPDEFRRLAHRMVDWIADYMREVEDLDVLSRAEPGQVFGAFPDHPPEQGFSEHLDSGWDDVFADLNDVIVPGLTHWQHPRFFGYFPCNASGPAILGELLSAGLNVQGMLWRTSPACTELETKMLDWMARAFGLPESFLSTSPNAGGVIQSTASDATLVSLVAARHRARRASIPDDRMTIYASDQAHSSVVKAAMIAGLADGPGDRSRVRLVATDDAHRMDTDALAEAMERDIGDGLAPVYVAATMGTTGSGAVDPLAPIGEVMRTDAPEAWLHVDGAWAGVALVCPEFRAMLDGIERADSLCINPHKWLLTNFDCDLLWTRDRAALAGALSITPEYLRSAESESGAVIDYRDWQVPLGRRFRALKLWFVVRHYGLEGLRAYIREHVALGERLESWIEEDDRFELAAPRSLALLCFRLKAGDVPTERLLGEVNASGRAFLTHTRLPDGGGGDRYAIRFAIGAPSAGERDVRQTWELIQRRAGKVLG